MWRALLLVSAVLPAAFSSVLDVEKNKGQVWAVLVAGSNYYGNYRHQADVCHAYQILHRNGVPDSNIIVMMYDDIANNTDNPKKGEIFNKPGGPNVYGPKAVPKDYTGDANFVHVLTGNQEAVKGVSSGKVLKSGPNDHVFVYFADHGAPGVVGFPSDELYAHELIHTLKTMHKQKMYKNLVFYMEACNSGSMFNKKLPENIEIFAVTAASPEESSFACYWSNELQTFLGDEFSISWMEDIDNEEIQKIFSSETLLKQYMKVGLRVRDSHPTIYGETSIDKDHVQDFLGKSKQNLTIHSESSSELEPFKDAVSSRDVALQTLTNKIALAETATQKKEFQKKKDDLVKGRKEVDLLLSRILSHVTKLDIEEMKNIETSLQEISLEMMPCYKTLVKAFSKKCVNIHKNQYTFSHLYKFANLCALQYPSTDVLEAFFAECGSLHQGMVNVD